LKNLPAPIPDDLYDVLKRIAKYERRKFRDFIYLILAEGLSSYYCERQMFVDKLQTEYTKEETDQIAKNAELEKTEGWNDLSWEERTSRGYVSVEDYWQHSDISKFENQLIDLITSNSHLTDEEVES
tara:strand:+ start:4120 stop:4500 length:381 start_codon:yes stop_codon:yes gene_type:complete